MNLRDAIAGHKAARSKLNDCKAVRMDLDETTFEELNVSAPSALAMVVDALEEGEGGFFEKLRYHPSLKRRGHAKPSLQFGVSTGLFWWFCGGGLDGAQCVRFMITCHHFKSPS